MKRHTWKKALVAALLTGCILLLSGCLAADLPDVGGTRLSEMSTNDQGLASQFFKETTDALVSGDAAALNALSPRKEDGSDSVDFSSLVRTYQDFSSDYGAYQSISLSESYDYGKNLVYVGEMTMERGTLMLTLEYTTQYELLAADLYETDEEALSRLVMPDTIQEEQITVGEGTDYPLAGKITYPREALESGKTYPAVVMVGADGANNMDMDAASTHTYRDIAWALAQQGIVTIRYDKRIYTYKEEQQDEKAPAEKFSITWEYTQDANRAADLLRTYAFVDGEKIYYLGHSQGGAVGSRAEKEGGSYAGFILLNSSPRPWYDVTYDQYINYGLIDFSDEEIFYIESKLKEEYDALKDGSYLETSDEDLVSQTALNRPIAYWKDLLGFDYMGTYKELKKPMLILQGEADYQITMEKDYRAFQSEFGSESYVTMRSFEGLNHLMTPSYGVFAGHYKEYDKPGRVSSDVTDAIASFINGRN